MKQKGKYFQLYTGGQIQEESTYEKARDPWLRTML
jgi:hypothetical protein